MENFNTYSTDLFLSLFGLGLGMFIGMFLIVFIIEIWERFDK